jgi:hypothetical protein
VGRGWVCTTGRIGIGNPDFIGDFARVTAKLSRNPSSVAKVRLGDTVDRRRVWRCRRMEPEPARRHEVLRRVPGLGMVTRSKSPVGMGSPVKGWQSVVDRSRARGVRKVMECARPLAPWIEGLPTRSAQSCAVAVLAEFKAVEVDRTPGRFAFAGAWRQTPSRSIPVIRA